MLRSLHMKLVLILVVLIILVMAVTGTFLINSVASYQTDDFKTQMASVFTVDFIDTLTENSSGSDAPQRLREMITAYSGSLGIDENRSFFILDGATGAYLAGSDTGSGAEARKTPNVITAMSGSVGDYIGFADTYMDLAFPLTDGEGNVRYVICVRDNKQRLRDLNWMLFAIIAQAMLFGLVVSIFLSFFLSKAMTIPLEKLTRSAAMITSGQFTEKLEVHSADEIGVLTGKFNEMSQVLKQTLEEVEGERNKLNTIFLHMADGVAAFTNNGALIHMNPAAENMLGIHFSPGMKFASVFPDVRVPSVSGEGDRMFIVSDYEKNGRQLKVYFAAFAAAEGENGLMAVIHDITEQSRLDASRREFVANVSHELRTPLTNIKSYIETLISDGDSLDPETRSSFMGVVSSEADRMTRIVSELLTLSKLDYGKLEMSFMPFSLSTLLEKTYNAMLMTTKNAGCELTLNTEPDLPNITGDRERISQVIFNILSNSIKYTPSGGRIDITARRGAPGYVEITVADTGIGIPKESLPRLFERFYRVDKARSREQGGTGLGLAIAKEIVERHGGEIRVESELGRGTSMTVALLIDGPEKDGGAA